MQMLREWRTEAEERGHTRIAELADYLQADELTHVKLATDWVRALAGDDTARIEELVRWGRGAVARIEGFFAENGDGAAAAEHAHFTFMKPGGERTTARRSRVIGE